VKLSKTKPTQGRASELYVNYYLNASGSSGGIHTTVTALYGSELSKEENNTILAENICSLS